MSRHAALYVAGIVLLGLISSGLAIHYATTVAPDWGAFGVLLFLAIPAQLYEAKHGRQSYYPHFVCFFAAVLLLPPTLFALIVLIPHLVEWARERWQRGAQLRAWYIQPFNIATHVLAGTSSSLLIATLHGRLTGTGLLPPVVTFSAAALLYVMVNHLIVGGVLALARGISFAESRVLTIDSLLPDGILASMGTLVAVLWAIDTSWVVLALLPLVLMYQALHVPQLKQEAETDSKTGLLNARYFTKRVTLMLTEAQRSETPLALIMADLDFLRTINTTHGHLAGDVIITGIAKIIKETIHDRDIAARFGGEEFIIALPTTKRTGATALGERLRRTIEQTPFVLASGETLHATISMGIACFPQDGANLTDLTHAADIAVYYAKFLGRNRVVDTLDVPHATTLEYLATQVGQAAAAPALAALDLLAPAAAPAVPVHEAAPAPLPTGRVSVCP